MKCALIVAFCLSIFFAYGQVQFDYGKQKDGNDWIAVNDGVMGGLSKGELALTNKSLKFKGTISLKNNGGFASFRNRYGLYKLGNVSTVKIKYRSSGQIMAISLEPNDVFYKPTYRILLEDTNSAWKTFEIKVSKFAECVLGEPTGNMISSNILNKIKRIGFINTEKKEGDFEIEIKYLKFE